MLVTFIAVVFAGFAGAGIVMLLRLGLKDRVPRWATPIAAGGCMIAATISSEYGWFQTTQNSLSEGLEVIATREHQSFYQPWTYIQPYVNSFVAIDHYSVQENAAAPDLRLFNAYLFERWRPTVELPTLVDCAEPRRADLSDGIDFEEDGLPIAPDWRPVAEDDALRHAACRGEPTS